MSNYEPTYIKGIDGIRAFAVIAVMLFHIYPQALPGGFTGVDVFFVISGYVVSSSLAKNYSPNLFKFIIDFYGRRILRIIPVLLIFLLISSFITTLFIPSSWLSETTSKTALASFFGYSNFALVWYNDGYFSPRIEFNPFVHTWSLAVEEQFYVIFPFIFFIWYRFKNHTSKFLSLPAKWLLAVLLISSLIYAGFETSSRPENAFYLLPSRFWELGFGALLFKLHSHNKLVYNSSIIHKFYLFFGLILILIGFQFANEKLFPFPWAIPSVIGTALLIIGLVRNSQDKSFVKYLFENKLIVYIGKISYSLYLWHWAIYVFFRWTIGLDTPLKMFVAIVITLLLSILSYHYIETPFRKNKYIHEQSKWKILLFGLLSLVIIYGGVKLIFMNQEKISLSVTKDKYVWYPYAYPDSSQINENPKFNFSSRKIFVLGDSHTGAYSTMLQLLSDEYKVKVLKFSSGGCGISDFKTPVNARSPHCNQYINDTLSQIESMASSGDILFLASLRMNRLCDQYAIFSEKDVVNNQASQIASDNRKIIIEETKKLIKRFEKKGIHVIIDAPKPIFKAPAFRCFDWFNSSNPICKEGLSIKRDFLLEHRRPVMEALKVLSNQFPQLIIWDPFPILCKAETCSVFYGDKPLFFDGDHLSAYGNRVLYPSFSRLIEKIFKNEDNLTLATIIYPRTKISFKSNDVLYTGWSYPEDYHRWSIGNSSTIKFNLKNTDDIDGILELHISTLGEQEITLIINNHNISSQIVNSSDTNITFNFYPHILNTNSINIIEFKFINAHKPSNGDSRILAMALKYFMLK
jgi:peptidoglycan/LPS O-acetylase OafA/YrhL